MLSDYSKLYNKLHWNNLYTTGLCCADAKAFFSSPEQTINTRLIRSNQPFCKFQLGYISQNGQMNFEQLTAHLPPPPHNSHNSLKRKKLYRDINWFFCWLGQTIRARLNASINFVSVKPEYTKQVKHLKNVHLLTLPTDSKFV